MYGLFISFEGTDGSGKSSVIEAIYQKLITMGYEVIRTREPGGSRVAEKIRAVILDVTNEGMDDKTEALLYAASRREHVVKTILPALKEGKIVLCDRFLDSSLAYQGQARHLGISEVLAMNQFATDGLLPDLTLVISVPAEVGLARIKQARNMDRLERETIQFHQDVYQGYQTLLQMYPNRMVGINGEQSKACVLRDAERVIMNFLKAKENL